MRAKSADGQVHPAVASAIRLKRPAGEGLTPLVLAGSVYVLTCSWWSTGLPATLLELQHAPNGARPALAIAAGFHAWVLGAFAVAALWLFRHGARVLLGLSDRLPGRGGETTRSLDPFSAVLALGLAAILVQPEQAPKPWNLTATLLFSVVACTVAARAAWRAAGTAPLLLQSARAVRAALSGEPGELTAVTGRVVPLDDDLFEGQDLVVWRRVRMELLDRSLPSWEQVRLESRPFRLDHPGGSVVVEADPERTAVELSEEHLACPGLLRRTVAAVKEGDQVAVLGRLHASPPAPYRASPARMVPGAHDPLFVLPGNGSRLARRMRWVGWLDLVFTALVAGHLAAVACISIRALLAALD